jgi:hypothetical protein
MNLKAVAADRFAVKCEARSSSQNANPPVRTCVQTPRLRIGIIANLYRANFSSCADRHIDEEITRYLVGGRGGALLSRSLTFTAPRL